MVPQLRRENSLLLWNVFDLNTPVHTFVGHDDVVLEFQWRKQKEGEWDRRQLPDVLLSPVHQQLESGWPGDPVRRMHKQDWTLGTRVRGPLPFTVGGYGVCSCGSAPRFSPSSLVFRVVILLHGRDL